jgi:regulatory protein
MPRQPFPGIITAIEPQTRTRKHLGLRMNIFIDDKFSFALDADLVRRYELRPDTLVNSDTLTRLLAEDGDARAYARALHFLGYRIRSAHEIETRLKRDEWPDEVITRVLARLSDEGLVNDASFAASWVESRSLHRPRGARMLQQELRMKGVEKEQIAAALPDQDQEIENALVAVEGKLRLWEKLEGRERERKIIEWLQRRGFSYSTARAALSRMEESRMEENQSEQ